jgi:hypothetical protein
MPFTISHIAAVLPFRKKTPFPLSFTGLIAGSMTPDFEYFIRMTLYGHYGHTFTGIFIFDLPVGIMMYLVYHGVVRRPLLLHLPEPLFSRLAGFAVSDWLPYFRRHYWMIVLSILIGTLTHLLWDGFTHDQEYVVARYIPLLLQPIRVAHYDVPLHALLQGLSSVIGLALLLLYMYRLPRTTSPARHSKPANIRFWTAVCIMTGLIFAIRWLAGVPAEKLWGQVIVISMSAFMLGLVIVCLYFDLKKK